MGNINLGSSTDTANKPSKKRDFREITWNQCYCSCSSQIPNQDDRNDYHQFLSLYMTFHEHGKTELIIYDFENRKKGKKVLDTQLILDEYTSITQLPNGDLFCYGSREAGTAAIIDRSYRVKTLPSGTPCRIPPIIYLNNNIYCFGGGGEEGIKRYNAVPLSRKFDLEKNKWIELAKLQNPDSYCHSVIFNGNILISGYRSQNLWLYSVEIDSFSILPYKFAWDKRKFLINAERLYLIEWNVIGSIYEGEDEYHWKLIAKSKNLFDSYQMYCLYNNGKICISTSGEYHEFDLKHKFMRKYNF